MQKEVVQVFNLIEPFSSHLLIERKPIENQMNQCVVMTDEDQAPYFLDEHAQEPADSSVLYLGFNKLIKILQSKPKFVSKDQSRFSSLMLMKDESGVSAELLDYLVSRWNGIDFHGTALFGDRLERYFCIGLDACHELLSSDSVTDITEFEFLGESASDRSMACRFGKSGMISIGSLISFRKKDSPASRRSLGVVNKITSVKVDGKIGFEVQILCNQVFAVTYKPYKSQDSTDLAQKALIYGVKTQDSEKSYIILESFSLKDGDLIRMTMNNEAFPIILRDRKNIGLGYWQFECRRVEELTSHAETTKGYDFI